MSFDDPQLEPRVIFRTVTTIPVLPDNTLETGTICVLKDAQRVLFLRRVGPGVGVQAWLDLGNGASSDIARFLFASDSVKDIPQLVTAFMADTRAGVIDLASALARSLVYPVPGVFSAVELFVNVPYFNTFDANLSFQFFLDGASTGAFVQYAPGELGIKHAVFPLAMTPAQGFDFGWVSGASTGSKMQASATVVLIP